MTDAHDPLCPKAQWPGSPYIHCQCHLINQVKALERMRLIDAIRDERAKYDGSEREARYAFDICLQIVRGGDV